MTMMSDRLFLFGLIALILAMILAIFIYVVAPEAYMVEECREHYTASTKICNGGLI